MRSKGKGGVVVALTRRRSKKVDEALSKLGGGQGVVVLFRHGQASPHAADRAASRRSQTAIRR
jgi:hypothetical protein